MAASAKSEDLRNDRRKYVRVGVYAVTRYFCPMRDREVGVQTRIADISEGGAKLITFMEGVPVGAPIKLTFIMPTEDSDLIAVEGVARHTGSLEKHLSRSGVEFTKVKKKDLLILRSYVAAHTKK